MKKYLRNIAFWIYQQIPEMTQNKWLGGIAVACWNYDLGYSFKFCLFIGNIYWKLPLIPPSWEHASKHNSSCCKEKITME